MTYYYPAGTPISDADAADFQWAGHTVFDVNGNPVVVPISSVVIEDGQNEEYVDGSDAL